MLTSVSTTYIIHYVKLFGSCAQVIQTDAQSVQLSTVWNEQLGSGPVDKCRPGAHGHCPAAVGGRVGPAAKGHRNGAIANIFIFIF